MPPPPGDALAVLVPLLAALPAVVGDLTGVLAAVAQESPTTTLPAPPEVDFSVGSVAVALLRASVFAVPLGVSLWALLDAARRPRWAWALSGRRQVVWMAVIMAGVLSVIGGLAISGWYLLKVRPVLARVEGGDIGPGRRRPDGS